MDKAASLGWHEHYLIFEDCIHTYAEVQEITVAQR
jgi:hypothetical protein